MFKISHVNEKCVVTPNGNIVASIVNEFRDEMKSIVDEEKQIVIDLSNVEMIDSMGLGALIATHNSMQKYDKKLELTNISKDLLSLMKTMRLDQHFKIN
ncbi:MAG: STAS domain-containing protein [Candidatus Marinimicrobia bacterium]|nr:STAS domain-containing protein [Candidatus Neomarinimicrobiota bacterium]